MTVGQLEARLKHYPREAKVMILATTQVVFQPDAQIGINILDDLKQSFVRPDFETVPSSVFLVPEQELVKA